MEKNWCDLFLTVNMSKSSGFQTVLARYVKYCCFYPLNLLCLYMFTDINMWQSHY